MTKSSSPGARSRKRSFRPTVVSDIIDDRAVRKVVAAFARHHRLSKQEEGACVALALGWSDKTAAQQLGLSVKTVQHYGERTARKTGAQARSALRSQILRFACEALGDEVQRALPGISGLPGQA